MSTDSLDHQDLIHSGHLHPLKVAYEVLSPTEQVASATMYVRTNGPFDALSMSEGREVTRSCWWFLGNSILHQLRVAGSRDTVVVASRKIS